jgi:NMD protein affecting ribosome stability and mRNA decay
MFAKSGKLAICAKCRPEEELDYEVLIDAVAREPNLTAEELAETTDVSVDCVLRCIRSGRIQHMTSGKTVRCGRCGSPAISMSKRLCEACLSKMSHDLAAAQSRIQLQKRKDVEIGRALNAKDEEEDERKESRSLLYRKRSE